MLALLLLLQVSPPPPPVTFTATRGTVTPGGVYTPTSAGPASITVTVGGRAMVIAGNVVAADVVGRGIPFGAYSLLAGSGWEPNLGPLTLTHDGYGASTIVSRITAARSKGVTLLLALTGGSHDNYMTGGVFDPAKWADKLQTYNSTTIRNAVAAAVADGTIIGASVMDEPHVAGAGDGAGSGDGNTWGPPGTMTKARVDSLCGLVRAQFPSLPVGVVHQWNVFEPTKDYRVCDFIDSQYSDRMGNVTAYRDAALALGRRSGHAVMFGLNILNGGTQDRVGAWDCGGAVKGQNAPNCQMTPGQVVTFGRTLGAAGCGLLLWRYDATYMARPDIQQAFRDVAGTLAGLPAASCRRTR